MTLNRSATLVKVRMYLRLKVQLKLEKRQANVNRSPKMMIPSILNAQAAQAKRFRRRVSTSQKSNTLQKNLLQQNLLFHQYAQRNWLGSNQNETLKLEERHSQNLSASQTGCENLVSTLQLSFMLLTLLTMVQVFYSDNIIRL